MIRSFASHACADDSKCNELPWPFEDEGWQTEPQYQTGTVAEKKIIRNLKYQFPNLVHLVRKVHLSYKTNKEDDDSFQSGRPRVMRCVARI